MLHCIKLLPKKLQNDSWIKNTDPILRAVSACIAIHYHQSQQGSTSASSTSNLFFWYTKPGFLYYLHPIKINWNKNERETKPHNFKFTVSSGHSIIFYSGFLWKFHFRKNLVVVPDYRKTTALSLETSLETKAQKLNPIALTDHRYIFTLNSVAVEWIY